ncbi:MAG: photosynthetic reaction center subunit H [Hyphomicrobiales bacterium]|nr:photosynthetic reaction center subunit H [Hyphomicrobiales bacterium]
MTNVIGTIDVAQIVLYAFWIFFFGLIFYLRREDRREGYPLVSDVGGVPENPGAVWMPTPKSFVLASGRVTYAPRDDDPQPAINATPIDGTPGAPYEPNGDPMLAAFGPGAYAERPDEPDLSDEREPRIIPLRAAAGFFVAERSVNPLGFPVFGADGVQAGTVSDIWVDRAETLIRYFEVQLPGGQTVLLPQTIADVDTRRGVVTVNAILASQFANVPRIKGPDVVTLLEEDKIMGYYGGGYLFATPQRSEPLF